MCKDALFTLHLNTLPVLNTCHFINFTADVVSMPETGRHLGFFLIWRHRFNPLPL